MGVDVLRNLSTQATALGPGPEGFSMPTRGLGEISLGMEGEFRLDLEDRVEAENGTVLRVPTMQVLGEDPRPERDGMSIRNTTITSYADGESPPQVQLIVDAPQAWAPLLRDAAGSMSLDRTREWTFENPTVRIPEWAAGQEVVLVTDNARLNPRTNEVECDGAFELRSQGLLFRGTGLRLDPNSQEIFFGEVDGELDWEITLDQGGTLSGACDGGGVFRSLSETEHELKLAAVEECWFELPVESGLPGRLEMDGLRLNLRSVESDWQPRHLDAEGSTFWSGESHLLRGGKGDVRWNDASELLGVIINGPIQAYALEQGGTWTSAQGGAHIDPSDTTLTLWDRVQAHQPTASVAADWATVDRDQNLHADGEIIVHSAHGLSFAEALSSIPGEQGLLMERIAAYPSAQEVDRIEAPQMLLRANESALLPQQFKLIGSIENEPWQLTGERLHTQADGNGSAVSRAEGGIEGHYRGAQLWSESALVREESILLRGMPALMQVPLESGNSAMVYAERIRGEKDEMEWRGKPRAELPAADLGLLGDVLTVRARRVIRYADGTWLFEHQVTLSGAATGSAQRIWWYADGRFKVERNDTDLPFVGTLETGQTFRLSALRIDGHPDGPLKLGGEIDAWMRGMENDIPRERSMQGSRAELQESNGWVEGDVRVTDNELTLLGQRANWETIDDATRFVTVTGNARFEHPRASGRGERMKIWPDRSTVELFRGSRRLAWIRLAEGQELESEWFSFDTENALLSSRNGVIRAEDLPQ